MQKDMSSYNEKKTLVDLCGCLTFQNVFFLEIY